MTTRRLYTYDDIEKAARIYHTAKDAAEALGIRPNSFNRLCRKYGIETPRNRRKRLWQKSGTGNKTPRLSMGQVAHVSGINRYDDYND